MIADSVAPVGAEAPRDHNSQFIYKPNYIYSDDLVHFLDDRTLVPVRH